MPRIQELPPALVDKIAAGEVIERPASVVKELLENALDAGARRVTLEIEGGGLRRIRIVDDGGGIHPEDLLLAVRSHATSKIRTADDLFAIRSLGFRGEALASIAAVSQLRLASRPPELEAGCELRLEGGQGPGPRPTGMPPGTDIEVADLFWNVPARRAFLKSQAGELKAIVAEVRRQALSRPDVHLTLTADGRRLLEAPAEDEPRERIAQLLGRELAEDLIAVPPEADPAGRLRGYVTPCDRSRGDTQQQWFFLNGRAVRDSRLLAAVRAAYANLLPPRRHPSLLLWLDVDPADVDVNVHPQKAEVRFRRDREVFFLVKRAIERALREHGLVAEMRLVRRQPEASWLSARPAPEPAPGDEPAAAPGTVRAEPAPVGGEDAPGAPPPPLLAGLAAPGRFFQLHRRYLVEETPQGLRLLDPHALHERILYEEIRERLAAEPLEAQRFLFPQVLEVEPLLLQALEERAPALERLGFEVAPFGRNAVAVHAAPRLLNAARVSETVRELLEEAEGELDPEEGETAAGDAVLHRLAAGLACRSAVRFGDELPAALAEELLRRRPQVRRGHCCPHGRPTALSLSLDEIDRRFRRQSF